MYLLINGRKGYIRKTTIALLIIAVAVLFIVLALKFSVLQIDNKTNSLACKWDSHSRAGNNHWFDTSNTHEANIGTAFISDSLTISKMMDRNYAGDRGRKIIEIGSPFEFETVTSLFDVAYRHDNKKLAMTADYLLKAKDRAHLQVSRGNFNRSIWPTRGTVTSPYGVRWGRIHAGIDIANDLGTKIVAARDGKVVFAGWQPGYGNTIILDHGMGWTSLYGHLAEYKVELDDFVRTGELIAFMGSTGNSTGPHLHFEVRWSANAVNPAVFFK